MPLTLSYDLTDAQPQHRNYLRSMLERFGWQRLGGSVFRYLGKPVDANDANAGVEEDWLNDIAPSLMFFRSYILRHNISVRFFTLDANSIARVDHSDNDALYGNLPLNGEALDLQPPTNPQSSARRIRRFVDASIDVLPANLVENDD